MTSSRTTKLGKRPTPTGHYKAFSWFGVSLFIDRGRIDRLAARAHEQGQRAGIARVRITPGDGLYAMYTSKSTHLEVFGFPEHLLARVDGIEN